MLRLGASFLCLRKRHADKERPQTQARTSIDLLPSSYPVITLLNHPRLLKLNFDQGGAGARAGAGARTAARARGKSSGGLNLLVGIIVVLVFVGVEVGIG